MKILFALAGLSVLSFNAAADLLPPPAQITITGAEASRLAESLPPTGERGAMTTAGNASVSCAKKGDETDFTCVISVQRGRHSVREPQAVKKDK